MQYARIRVGATSTPEADLAILGIDVNVLDPVARAAAIDALEHSREGMKKAKEKELSNLAENTAAAYIAIAPFLGAANLVAAPLVTFFVGVLEAAKWMIEKFGLAGGGLGYCVDPGPPNDEADPRWWHFTTGSGIARHDALGAVIGWGPLEPYMRNEFERWIMPLLARVIELQANCREFNGLDSSEASRGRLVLRLVDLWNSQHTSIPSDPFYPGRTGFGQADPPGAFGPLYAYGPSAQASPYLAHDNATRGFWVRMGPMVDRPPPRPIDLHSVHNLIQSLSPIQQAAMQAQDAGDPNGRAAILATAKWLTYYKV